MKKLVLLLLLFVSFGVQAQRFPSVDSLQKYILRYVKNSAVESFTNLRMQNVVYGLTEFFTSQGIDTIWKAGDTLKYRKNGVNRTVGIFSGGGGSTDTTSLSNRINLKLNITDTSAMLANYIRRQELKDTASALRTTINGKQGALTLTTTGTSGASTLVGNTLNIPQYSGGGGGSQTLQQTTDLDSTTTRSLFIGSDGVIRNDTAQASPYQPYLTAAANYGSQQYRWGISYDPSLRIRQKGQIKFIKVYMDNVPGRLSSFYFTVWRKTAGVAFEIIDSVNILPYLSTGTNVIQMPHNVFVQDGDYVGWGYASSGTGSNFLSTGTFTGGTIGYYYDSTTTHPPTGTAWVGSQSTQTYLPIEVYMNSPDAVFIGDSKTVGYNTSIGAYTEEATSPNRHVSYPDVVADSLNWTIQNMGIGNQTSTQVAARFQKDVVDKNPMYAIIEMGVNDVNTAVSTATIMANWNTVLALCTTNNIKPVIVYILPWTNGSDAENQQVDTINTNLAALAVTYSALTVDARSTLGKNRVSGPPGNFWDIQTSPDYDGDGVHYEPLGYKVLGNLVTDVIHADEPVPFENPNPKGAIFRVSSRTKGLGLPIWDNVQRVKIDNNLETGVGIIGYQEDGNEGLYVHRSDGMKRLLTESDVLADSTTQVIADGATVTFNTTLGKSATVTLGGNRTLAITNFNNGTYLSLRVIQDGTGGRTLALPAGTKVIGGGAGAVTLSTASGSVDVLTFWKIGDVIYCNFGLNYN